MSFGQVRLAGVPDYPVDDLRSEIKPRAIVFDTLHNTPALEIMREAIRHKSVQHPLAVMTEGCMPKVVPKSDSLCQILVKPQRNRNGAGYLAHLESMRKACAVMVGMRDKKNLCLVF